MLLGFGLLVSWFACGLDCCDLLFYVVGYGCWMVFMTSCLACLIAGFFCVRLFVGSCCLLLISVLL